MLALIRGNLELTLQRESDVVQAIEKAVTSKLVNCEARAEAVIIVDRAGLKVYAKTVVWEF